MPQGVCHNVASAVLKALVVAVTTPQPQPASSVQPSGRSSRASRPNSRGSASTLHVDLGEELKSSVLAAAQRAGMRPSDWVRSQLKAAATAAPTTASTFSAANAGAQADASKQGRAHGRDLPGRASEDLFTSPRTHQLTLQAEDLEPLDRVASAGGFRSRPAALRFLLRHHDNAQSLAALRALPQTIPALAESNMALQLAVRMAQAVGFAGDAGAGADPALRRDIQAHMDRAARVVAALQPLLSARK